jgi:hypothetical protein
MAGTNMRIAHRLVGFAVLVAASVSCGDVARQGRSPVYLTLDSLQATSGGGGGTGSLLLSDVQKLIITPAPCSAVTPCPTTFNDVGTATMRIVAKDVVGLPAPTTNNEVTIHSYHVTFRRSDGRNTPGVDVPFPFDGAVTGLVGAGAPSSIGFELVKHVAKEESPLVQLVSSRTVITTFAEVTFYGTDRVGNDISVTGTIQVDFGNFGDS